MTAPRGLRTWIDVDTRALARNVRAFRRRLAPVTQLMAVVKSNAYGHDLIAYARTVARCGADWLGVDSIVEALALREAHIRLPLLVLGATLPERLAEAAHADACVTVSHLAALRALRTFRAPRPLRIHLKFDTGMHRQGFLPHETPAVIRALRALPHSVIVAGAYTHFADAKNPAIVAGTQAQLDAFLDITRALADTGFHILRHAAATSGTLVLPESQLDLVRIGIGLYGLWPSPEVCARFARELPLVPVLSWRTILTELKTLPAGNRIGYNGTEVLTRRSRVAVCPIGYWHGYPRALSGIGHVIVRGVRCRILGRVSMDMITVDVTRVPGVCVGDVATLIGSDRHAAVTADDLASLTGTINYEIITRLNPLMLRKYR